MWYGGFKKAGAEMAKVYSRVSKINNIVGRSDYISNPDRQEFIKLTGKPKKRKGKKTTKKKSKQGAVTIICF